MDLRQLRHFRQIAESGSVSAASGVVHVAQPALSRQMRALEEEFGTPLFVRTGRGVLLTPAGQSLLVEARHLLDEADRVSKYIRSFGTRLSGEATIGLSPTIGRLLTLPLAQCVRADYPALKLRIAEAFSGTLLEWLQTGRIDAAILYHKPVSGSIQSELVGREPLSIIGGSDAIPFPARAEVPIRALAGHSLVLPTPQHGLRKMVDEHVATHGVPLDLMFEFDALDAMIAVARQGIALTILPESAVRPELASGTLRAWRIGDPALVRPIVIATASQRADAIGQREIVQLLRRVILSTAQESGWGILSQSG
ncbi:LysR family transcriptional regulator [Sphingobium sp. EM0848]|uniref:LysR family transcriptional regulator n=1 Tax=Sphingobium sp. EM0848 TaxID=2743473 RepID=UPI00159C11B0|nr:LysR family transcriptional regulator [Sphingobium sp. EM0848]